MAVLSLVRTVATACLLANSLVFGQGINDPDGGDFVPSLGAIGASFPDGVDSDKPFLATELARGQYEVEVRTDSAFPNRTIYVPQGTGNKSIPIFAWENGICYKYGNDEK